MGDSTVVVLVQYQAQPEESERAAREISGLVATVVAAEPECGGIEILQNADDPAKITLVERWPGRETFLGPHTQQPHIQEFISRAGAFLARPPEISFWQARSGA